MNLSTLGEKRIRGDFIETFKLVTGYVYYAKVVLELSRSGSNIINNISNKSGRGMCNCNINKYFLPERIRNYLDKLTVYVKLSENNLDLKINLEKFKTESIDSIVNNFW